MNTNNRIAAEDRFGRRFVAKLSEANDEIPHEISERLKAARMVALSKRKLAKAETATAVVTLGDVASLQLGGEKLNWWNRVFSVLPLVALVVGLLAIEMFQDEFWADEVASVDAELLSDDLPTEAYTDPGFAQYLRSSGRN